MKKKIMTNLAQRVLRGKLPKGTCRRNDVILTSMRRHNVASTSVRRHFNVMCLLGLLYSSDFSSPRRCDRKKKLFHGNRYMYQVGKRKQRVANLGVHISDTINLRICIASKYEEKNQLDRTEKRRIWH